MHRHTHRYQRPSPLSLAAGVPERLLVACLLAALLWGGVAWAVL